MSYKWFVLCFCFCLQSVNQTAARSTMDLDEELKRTCQNISTGYYPRVYTLFSPLQWQRITCTQCYSCLDGVFCFTDLMLCWQCGIGKKHLRIVEPAASIFSSRLPIVCTHRPTLPMPYPLSIILILFFRSSQFSCKILVIYWRLIVLFCFCLSKLLSKYFKVRIVSINSIKCVGWTALYIHENTNIYIPSVA